MSENMQAASMSKRRFGRRDGRQRKHKVILDRHHPTGAAFLDESGAISHDRFFSVGCLLLEEPSALLRAVQKLRDRHHWYKEIHWAELTFGTLPLYRELIELVAQSDARFSCFVADRTSADPVHRFAQNPWRAYEKLATQLLIGSIQPYELVSVVADNYSTPDEVHFEQDVRAEVNRRLARLAAVSVCRLDSRACDPLQIVDVLTGAATFEFRQNAGIAGSASPKAALSAEMRSLYGVQSVLEGARTHNLNVAIYSNGDGATPGSAKPLAGSAD